MSQEYRVLHLGMNSLNLTEESARGEKMTNWTVYSVAKLVFTQQAGQMPLKNIHGGILSKNGFKWISNVVNCNCNCLGPFTSRHTGPGYGS